MARLHLLRFPIFSQIIPRTRLTFFFSRFFSPRGWNNLVTNIDSVFRFKKWKKFVFLYTWLKERIFYIFSLRIYFFASRLFICSIDVFTAIGRTLIPRYFRSIFEGGVTELYYNLKHPKESFHNTSITLDCDNCVMVTHHGKPMFTKVSKGESLFAWSNLLSLISISETLCCTRVTSDV